MTLKPAEQHLQELGIDDPKDIDVDAIAFYMGALVKYEPLSGCEASIVGVDNRAIIRIDSRNNEPSRQRFSVAHECGHWFHHRGRSFRCRSQDIGNPRYSEPNPERVADDYAADLLMPRYLFEPQARRYPYTSFRGIKEQQEIFRTSLMAMARRFVDIGPDPVVLICHSKEKRDWFIRSPKIHNKWFPMGQLDSDSCAYDIVRGNPRHAGRRMKMPAETWFDFHDADEIEVYEESIPYGDRVMTLITFMDSEQAEG